MKIYSPQIIGQLDVDGNSTITGSLEVTGGITGSLLGTASFADSASFAVSASYAPDTTFPYTGSARITGSLQVLGDSTFSGSIIGAAGTNGYRQINIVNRGYTNTVSGDGNNDRAFVIGSGNTINKGGDIAIGLDNNTGYHGSGQNNFLLGRLNTIANGGQRNYNYLVGFSNNITTEGNGRMIMSYDSNMTLATGSYGGIFAGYQNDAGHANSVVVGGTLLSTTEDNQVVVPKLRASGSITTTDVINQTGTNKWINSQAAASSTSNQAVIASSNSFTFNSAAKSTVLIATENSTVNANASQAFVLGGGTNTVSQLRTGIIGGALNTATTANAYLFGAGASTINASSATTGYDVIVGGVSHQIIGSSDYSVVIGGDTNTINNADSAVILGGTGHTNAQNRSVIIGGQNITAAAADTVYVPNLYTTGSATIQGNLVITGSARGEVETLAAVSNTASLDLSRGNFFTITLESGSDYYINPSNILPGQTINLKLTQPDVGFGTVSFPSSVKQVSGSAYVPTATAQAVDIVTLISFDSTSLYLANVKNLV